MSIMGTRCQVGETGEAERQYTQSDSDTRECNRHFVCFEPISGFEILTLTHHIRQLFRHLVRDAL